MKIHPLASQIQSEATEWRRAMHAHPQTAYEETFAADLVAERLTAWGIPHEREIATTGIVATIDGSLPSNGEPLDAIGLRADMDALDITEKSGQPWTSTYEGKMHACGHDGHTAMLLGAAKILNETKQFSGQVHLIFQPAEEGRRGADLMIEQGLFQRYPCRHVFGVHNSPWLPLGQAELRPGPLLAAVDEFQINLTGQGGHAAYPQTTKDPLPAASELVLALQTIVGRNVPATREAVLSVTNFNAGTGAFNVIGDSAQLTGTVRTFDEEVRDLMERRLREITAGVTQAHDLEVEIVYQRAIDATINTVEETRFATSVLQNMLGGDQVNGQCEMVMGGEDFGSMLREVNGAYVFLGQGTAEMTPHAQPLHSPFYDFNDALLPIGMSYFVALVEAHSQA